MSDHEFIVEAGIGTIEVRKAGRAGAWRFAVDDGLNIRLLPSQSEREAPPEAIEALRGALGSMAHVTSSAPSYMLMVSETSESTPSFRSTETLALMNVVREIARRVGRPWEGRITWMSAKDGADLAGVSPESFSAWIAENDVRTSHTSTNDLQYSVADIRSGVYRAGVDELAGRLLRRLYGHAAEMRAFLKGCGYVRDGTMNVGEEAALAASHGFDEYLAAAEPAIQLTRPGTQARRTG